MKAGLRGLSCLLAGLLVGCSTLSQKSHEGCQSNDYLVGSVLWAQHSAEAKAIYYQNYYLAKTQLKRNLRQQRTEKKPALVIDVDETVLDNTPYEVHLIRDKVDYPKGWLDWMRASQADPIPGAKMFLEYADAQDVAIFYVTNRDKKAKKATLKNLRQVGFPHVKSERLLMKDDDWSKEARRDEIRTEHEIILGVGDNLNDFKDVFGDLPVRERAKAVDQYKKQFGQRYIVMPNPMYGDWEGAVYDYNWDVSQCEKRRMRHELLEGPED